MWDLPGYGGTCSARTSSRLHSCASKAPPAGPEDGRQTTRLLWEKSGGGDDEPKDWRVLNAGIFAEEQFEQFAIEILRAVARGTDDQRRVSRTLIDLFSNLQLSERPVSPLVEEGLRQINARLVPENYADHDHDLGWLLKRGPQACRRAHRNRRLR